MAKATSTQPRLAALLDDLTGGTDGRHETPWPGFRCFRSSSPTSPLPTVYTPSLCIVAQGAKVAHVGERVFHYDTLHYLVTGAAIPAVSHVTEADEDSPFLSAILEIDSSEVHDLVLAMESAGDDAAGDGAGGAPVDARAERDGRVDGPPIRVSPVDDELLDAIVRFVAALERPMDRQVLAPQYLREVLFLALQRDQGDLLRLAAGQRERGAVRAMKYLSENFHRPLDVPTIASRVGLSASSLHHTFKAATALTPIQYLKRLRLNHARQLMLDEGCQAAEAALRVGYESPSHFSREFKRLYGLPPRRYVENWGASAS